MTKSSQDATQVLSTTASVLDKVAGRIYEVSSLPHVAMQVIEVVSNPRSSASELKEVVESDPALMARVLRTVNSAAYGLRVRVDRVHTAISLLGFNEVRNLAVTASVADIFKKDEAVGTYHRKELWRHLVSVAVGARMVAGRAGLAQFEEAFLAGLLHDLGIILEDQYLHKPFVHIVESLSPDRPLCAIERERLGFDHTQLGGRVAESWRFPPGVVAAVRHHHASDGCTSEHKVLVQAVEVANYICSSKDVCSMGVHNVAAPSAMTLAGCSIGRQDLKVLWEDFDRELANARTLINM